MRYILLHIATKQTNQNGNLFHMNFIVNLKENILNPFLCVDKNGSAISTLILKKLIGPLKKMLNFSQ